MARPSIISAIRWSASASYVFYADNKWNVAFEAGFRRSASREPFLRGDLVAREEEGTNTHTHTYTCTQRRERERGREFWHDAMVATKACSLERGATVCSGGFPKAGSRLDAPQPLSSL